MSTAAQTAVTPPPETVSRPRMHLLDLARGIAILTVIAYHFCWDLESFNIHYFGLFEAPFWLTARTLIAGSFLFIAGFGLVLATRGGVNWRRFGLRLLKILLGAAIVTASTFYYYPEAGVFFGILHLIALSSVIGLAFVRLPWWLTFAAGFGVAALDYFPQAGLSADWLLWLGMGTREVWAVDYVPIVPWFSGFLFGIAACRLLLATSAWAWFRDTEVRGGLSAGIRFLGRHTLVIYLIHQPILFGLFNLWFMLNLAPMG